MTMSGRRKPQYIREIQEHTGLECVPVDREEATMIAQEYWVVSPTGVKLFRVGSHSEDIIGMAAGPDMFNLQGISEATRHARMRNQ